jgi:hypothetical protein
MKSPRADVGRDSARAEYTPTACVGVVEHIHYQLSPPLPDNHGDRKYVFQISGVVTPIIPLPASLRERYETGK